MYVSDKRWKNINKNVIILSKINKKTLFVCVKIITNQYFEV